jgi:coenzyme F420-reducing hydrogenase beta subunit
MHWNRDGFLEPKGPAPDSFAQICPFSPVASNEDDIAGERFAAAPHLDARIGRFEAAYVGHAIEQPFRPQASSGGLTSWVAAELLRTGAVDGIAHVVPADPASGAFSNIGFRTAWTS